jgi:hypothetical protein
MTTGRINQVSAFPTAESKKGIVRKLARPAKHNDTAFTPATPHSHPKQPRPPPSPSSHATRLFHNHSPLYITLVGFNPYVPSLSFTHPLSPASSGIPSRDTRPPPFPQMQPSHQQPWHSLSCSRALTPFPLVSSRQSCCNATATPEVVG